MIDQFSTQPPSQPSAPTEEQRSSSLWITILAGIVLVAIALISWRVAAGGAGSTGFMLSGVFALVCFAGALLSWRGLVFQSSALLIVSMLLLTISLPYFAAGQVTAPAIASLLLITAVASATLPSYWTVRAALAAIAASTIAIIADLYLPATFGIHSRQIAAVPLSVALAAAYIYFILRRFDTYSLRLKLLITFILVTIVPLAILGFYNNIVTRNTLNAQGNAELKNLTTLTATQVDAYVRDQLDSLRVQAQQPEIAAYLERDPFGAAPAEGKPAALLSLASFVRKDPLFIESYGILNAQGVDILDTNDQNIGRREEKARYFTQVIRTGEVYATNLVFREATPVLIFSAPIRSADGATIGVLRAEINAKVLQSILSNLVTGPDSGRTLSIIDTEYYLRLADTGDSNTLYKSYRSMTDANIQSLQETGVLRPGAPQDAMAPSESILWSLQNIALTPFFTAYSDFLKDDAVMTAASLRSTPWLVVASQAQGSLFAPIRAQTRGIVLISLLLILASAAASLIASRILMQPIIGLTQVAEKISTGYLTARAQAPTRDEIGTLALAFNNMTFQLRQALTGLETRVSERTADLEKSRRQSEGRAQRLQAISDVARAISAEQNLEKLLPLVASLVSEKFSFYHTGIFLLDPTRRFAVLRATNSPGGQHMLERGHRLEVGQTGIVGLVSQTGKPRIALDVGTDAVFFNNPDLPETRSEMAVPLMARREIIGVLDFQSTQSNAFSQDDLNTAQILADQIAIAIENARLFGQNEQALSEVRSLYSQYLRQEWQSFAGQENRVGYQHTLAGGRFLDQPVESDEIRMALQTGKAQVISSGANGGLPRLVIPIILRGETLGVLNVASPEKNKHWSQEELNLVQSVTERLALALENARLLQDSLRRAAKEQKIGQITTRIGASINMRNMLQVAVEELGRALPGSDVIIQFRRDADGVEQNRMSR
jgi:GAF domain-containing protein/HAMP domain-containing protein